MVSYEIDFIGVSKDKVKKDSDSICFRWKEDGSYKTYVYDCGYSELANSMTDILNQYYFDDPNGDKDKSEKTINSIFVSHPDQDHCSGIVDLLDNFKVDKIYMNRPWMYVDDIFESVNDGRITKDSLIKRLKKNYHYVKDIEDKANVLGITICEAFQGDVVDKKLRILSPSKEFYENLIIESQKNGELENKEEENESSLFPLIEKAKEFASYIKNLIETWNDEKLRENVSTSAENEMSTILLGEMESGQYFLLDGDAGIRAFKEAMDFAEKNILI